MNDWSTLLLILAGCALFLLMCIAYTLSLIAEHLKRIADHLGYLSGPEREKAIKRNMHF